MLEWNLAGDTIYVQKLDKNKVTDKYLAKLGDNVNSKETSSLLKDQKLDLKLSLKDKQVSSFFGWLANLVENVVGWIGELFGLSRYVGGWNEGGYWEGYRLDPINMFSSTDENNGGGGGGGYTFSGNYLYNSYVPGYQSPNGSNGGEGYTDGGNNYNGGNEWGPYPNSGGRPPHGPNPSLPNFSESVSYLSSQLDLTTDEIAFLQENYNDNINNIDNSIASSLETYLESNSPEPWNEKLEFAQWAIDYLNKNRDADINEMISNNNIPNSNINLPNLDVSELNNYPAFKNLVENLPSFLNNYPKVLTTLSITTNLKEKKIQELMQPGKGPKVIVVNNLKDKYGRDILGHYDRDNRILQIDDTYVSALSSANTPYKYQSIGLMLTIVTLHEFVHFGRHNQDLDVRYTPPNSKNDYEAGEYFEYNLIQNGNVGLMQPENAKEWMKYFKIRPKN